MNFQDTQKASPPTGCENLFSDMSVWDRDTDNNIHMDTTSSDRMSGRYVSDFMPVTGRRVQPVVRPIAE